MMNENFRELAIKAQLEHCVSHVRLQEFAELIVQDCMNEMELMVKNFDDRSILPLNVSVEMMCRVLCQKFGVDHE